MKILSYVGKMSSEKAKVCIWGLCQPCWLIVLCGYEKIQIIATA